MKGMKWIAVSFVGILAVFFIFNMSLITEPVSHYVEGELDFEELRNEIQEELKSDVFFLKNQFVNLNGWISKMIGKRDINGVICAENGMLFFKSAPKLEMGLTGQKIANVNTVLCQMNIPFVYVQEPSKIDLRKEIVPVGVENFDNENADSLLAELAARSIKTIDLRQEICPTAESVERYFFRTDHHWNYRGAFKAFQILVPMIQSLVNDSTDISMYIDESNWEIHKINEAFLGSQGKRVGMHVTGLDDFEYYTPKFETDMTMMRVQEGDLLKGDFIDCIVRKDILEDYKNYFDWKSVLYCSYIGSDYGLVEHRNRIPASNKKILIIKDSFVLPLQSYLSTIYKEVDVLDMRVYTQSSLIEYVQMTQPDLVLLLHNPSTLDNLSGYNYGYEMYSENIDWTNDEIKTLMTWNDIIIDKKDIQDNYISIYEGFDSDTRYMLEIDQLTIDHSDTDCVMFRLYDRKTNATILNRMFDMRTDNKMNGIKWYFETPEDDCREVALLLYSGVDGETSGVLVNYSGILLSQGWSFKNAETRTD